MIEIHLLCEWCCRLQAAESQPPLGVAIDRAAAAFVRVLVVLALVLVYVAARVAEAEVISRVQTVAVMAGVV